MSKNRRKVKLRTRHASGDKYVSVGQNIANLSDLPTWRNVAEHFKYLEDKKVKVKCSKGHDTNVKSEGQYKNVKCIGLEARKICYTVICDIWMKANPRIHLQEKNAVMKKLKDFQEDISKFNGNRLNKRKSDFLLKKRDKLFNITSCTCSLPIWSCSDFGCVTNKRDPGSCSKIHYKCVCPNVPVVKKIPVEEREYMNDQRTKTGTCGKFQIGFVDKKAKPYYKKEASKKSTTKR